MTSKLKIRRPPNTNCVSGLSIGDPWGNRTPVAAVRGRSLSRLTNGPLTLYSIPYFFLKINTFHKKNERIDHKNPRKSLASGHPPGGCPDAVFILRTHRLAADDKTSSTRLYNVFFAFIAAFYSSSLVTRNKPFCMTLSYPRERAK